MVPFSLDLGTWEKIGSELEKPLCKGVALLVSIWSTWTLMKSILGTLQTPESSEGSKDECETPSEGGPKYAEPKLVEQKTQEVLKTAVPSAPLFGEDEFPLPPFPPSPGLTTGEAQAFPSLKQTAVLSPLQKGICCIQQEGDLDSMTMAFPETIHEWIAPGTDPNNPTGVYEAVHKQILFKILKELKQAVQNHGVNSPFTLGIVQGQWRAPISLWWLITKPGRSPSL